MTFKTRVTTVMEYTNLDAPHWAVSKAFKNVAQYHKNAATYKTTLKFFNCTSKVERKCINSAKIMKNKSTHRNG